MTHRSLQGKNKQDPFVERCREVTVAQSKLKMSLPCLPEESSSAETLLSEVDSKLAFDEANRNELS